MRHSWFRRPAFAARLGIGVAATIAALALGGCGSGSSAKQASANPQFGPFAGYVWNGDVREVGAVIRVPKLADDSPAGVAGTWIGAEAPAPGRSLLAPFFQVGVNEVRGAGTQSQQDAYYAFWSSTRLRFHPRALFTVKPGDSLRLSMRLSGSRWVITARDIESSAHRSLSVRFTGQLRFNQAIWQQEDVTSAKTSEPLPYPDIEDARFSALLVNDQAPRRDALQKSWMSTDRGIFGPTRPSSDAFTIVPVHPSAEALHFQRIAVADDLAVTLFDTKLASWSVHTSAAVIRRAARTFGRALGRNIAALRSYRWSVGVSTQVHRLVVATVALRAAVLRLQSRTSAYLPAFLTFLGHSDIHGLSVTIRRRLHIPLTDLSAGSVMKYVQTH